MVLSIDPRLPLVWRSPESLQWGVSRAVAVLDRVSPADERMIAALIEGISESGLLMIGRAAGANDADVAALLTRVRPALAPPTSRPRVVRVVGRGPTATAVANGIAAHGHSLPASPASSACDLAVVVANFVIAPELHGYWLRRDIPHLPVVVTDSTVDIGPIVEPGLSPCLRCAVMERSEIDPAWPAIAAQLVGRDNPVDTALVAGETAALVARLVSARLRDGPATEHRLVRLDLESGEISTAEKEAHPNCGCISLRSGAWLDAAASAEDRGENDSVGVAPVVTLPQRHPRSPPTRERGESSLA